MKKTSFWFFGLLSLFLYISILNGCASLISPFNQTAYEYATSLKVEALALMDKATEPYSTHQEEINEFMMEVEKAYEYAKGRPKNEISSQQWERLKDPNKNLLGGFMKRWKEKETLKKTFIQGAKGIVSDAFDTIIGLESGKIKPSEAR